MAAARPLRNPIQGADQIACFFIGLAGKNAGYENRVKSAMINGAIGACSISTASSIIR